MTDRQIQCFLEVCKEMNFTKAAERLYIPQPAVSRYISSLEKELGVALFIRESSRSISLTDHGKTFYNMFQRFSSEFNNTMNQIHSELKPLRFGYNSGWNISGFLPEVIDKCRKENPDFQITIDCLRFANLTQALLDDKLDAIISIESYNRSVPGVEYDRIAEIPRYIFFSRSRYPDAAGPKDFYNEDFLIADDPHIRSITSQIEKYCAPYHFVPRLKTVANIDTVLAGVENGLGVAILDEWTQGIHHPDIGSFEIGSRHPISLVWRAGTYSEEIRILHHALLDNLNPVGATLTETLVSQQ